MLLDNHLEQIVASAKSIGELEFPPPKIYTNALLGNHEITTLIRDTEPHERSLFTIDPTFATKAPRTTSRKSNAAGADVSTRRMTIGQVQQRNESAVARVLGNDLLRQIQQSSQGQGRARGVNIEVLLHGAETLHAAYPVAGTKERISRLRHRHAQLVDSVSRYEDLVLKQQAKLTRQHNQKGLDDHSDEISTEIHEMDAVPQLTEADIRADEEEIKELETRKKLLEDRVEGMERDLGGLLR